MDFTPGGGLTYTGDADLENYISQYAATLGPAPIEESPFKTELAERWARYWAPKPNIPMSPRYSYRRPGNPGFGVLAESKPGGKRTGSLKGQQDFYVERERGGKEGGSLKGVDTKAPDRTRLQALADRFFGRPATPTEVSEFWGMGLLDLDAAGTIGADPKDPWHWLEARAAQQEADRAKAEKGSGPRTETQVQRTINLTDPVTAGTVVDVTLRNVLGRRATYEERQQFLSTLREQEESSPGITTTSYEYDGEQGTPVSVSSTTTGGAPDAGTAAQAWADEEHMEEQQAVLAASYLDVLKGL